MKSFMGYHYFWAMFWDQKLSSSHIELYQLIEKKKRVVVALELNNIVTLRYFGLKICVPLSYTCLHRAIWVSNFDIHW